MTEVKTKEVKIAEKTEEMAIQGFIGQAIEKGLPVETMEKLFNLRSAAKAEFAREQFMIAMADFQKNCPIITKEKIVNGKDGKKRYSYASLDSIVNQIKTPLADSGLSYEFNTIDESEFLKVTCTITHILGHSKTSDFKIPIGKEDYMTDTQKYGARSTFGKRYALCNALGIVTADEDIDANDDKTNDKDNKITKELISEVKNTKNETELKSVWEKNKGLGKEFAKIITEHKTFLQNVAKSEKNDSNS